jgi:hypothetical protein
MESSNFISRNYVIQTCKGRRRFKRILKVVNSVKKYYKQLINSWRVDQFRFNLSE